MVSWFTITGLGDTVVMMPAAAAIAVWLALTRAWRLALLWCLLFGLGLFAVLATKIAFVGWGIGIRALDFTGISGHAMRACAVLPVLCFLGLRGAAPALRHGGLLLGFALGALVSISRLAVHAHSVSEVVAGAALGLLISLAFLRYCRTRRALAIPRWLLAFSLLALLPTSHAEPAPTTRWINDVALFLSGHERPFERDAWHACRPRQSFTKPVSKEFVRLIY